MIQTSDAYREMMKKPIRNRGYISVALGVINQNAQGDVSYYGNTEHYGGTYYSKGDIFKELQSSETYGSLEHNFTKANGKFLFVPRENAGNAYYETGYISNGFAQVFEWDFNTEHDIKGLTIEFEPTSYPTAFTIETYGTDGDTYHFTNNSATFETDTTFGNVSEFVLTVDPDYAIADNAVKMSGGAQYLHIRRILCGIGVNFQGDTIESAELESFISGISAEVSYKDLSLSVIDAKNAFDVDQTESFINYLEPLQPMAVSIGVDLDDGTKEWFQIAECKLKEWSSRQGKVNFTATDLLAQSETEYSHMVIQSRTAKSEFQAIFADMGLTPDDYEIDDNLASVYITNPVEANTQRDCLQLLANATRSIVYEDENSIIHVEQAFSAYMPPNETTITTNNVQMIEGSYVSKNASDEYGALVDASKNLYNPLDSDNTADWDDYEASGAPITLFVQDNELAYNAQTYEESIVENLALFYELGQTGNHRPFDTAGDYTVSLKLNRTSANEYVLPSGWLSGSVFFGSIEIQSTNSTADSFRLHITQEAINSGHDPELWVRHEALKFKGYSGVVQLQIEKGTTKTTYAQYKYNYTPIQITSEWDDLMPFSQFKARFSIVPSKVRITAYANNVQVFTDEYTPTSTNFETFDNFGNVNKVLFEVLGCAPYLRIGVHDFSIGHVTPYELSENDIFDIYKAKEAKVKSVKVKIYTYELEDGEIRLVDDDVWYTETLGAEGIDKTVENPLISSSAQAELVAKWIADYFSKQKTYDIEFRGEPALQAHDYIKMSNQFTDSLVVGVETNKLTFNGAFHGQLSARQAN